MSDDETPEDDNILVFRGHDQRPVAVPHDVAIANERPLRAYELHQGGLPWAEVAVKENYPSAQAARMDVSRYMEEAGSLIRDFTRKQLFELQLSKLLRLQAACWPAAISGNPAMISQAHSLILSQNKLLRLDVDVRDDEDSQGNTVIVPNDDEGYSRALERVAGEPGKRPNG